MKLTSVYIFLIFLLLNFYTPGPLYNTVLVKTLITVGPQLVILDYFCYLSIDTFYSHYNTVWIANTEIGLDPNNYSVIKRGGVHSFSSKTCVSFNHLG